MLTPEYTCDSRGTDVYPQHIWEYDGKIKHYRCSFCRKVRVPRPDAVMSPDWRPSPTTE